MPAAFTLLASQGPFGPTYLTCVLLPLFLLAPFALLAVAARSLLSNEPLPRWLLAAAVLGAAGAGWFLWAEGFRGRVSGFWAAWRLAGAGAVLVLPVVLLREAGKRGWFRGRD
jgi:hypothetical protein